MNIIYKFDLTLTYFSVNFLLEYFSVYCSSQSFLYEKMHNFGLGNRIIPNYRSFMSFKEHPEPLPTSTRSPDWLRSPFKNLYQGSRKPNDTRVYRRRFEFEAQPSGHQVFCEGRFNCVITHLAIETNSGIPILLRGGVGHRYFVVVTKAKTGNELNGTVRAYCMKNPNGYYLEHSTAPPNYNYRFSK